MDPGDVLPLEPRAAAPKRPRPSVSDPGSSSGPGPGSEEETLRRKNIQKVSVLGAGDSSVRQLEDMLFGGEEELLENLLQDEEAEPVRLREEAFEGSDQSEEEDEDQVRPGPPEKRPPAWVDEDDEQDEMVDMKHRFRKALMKGDTETTMSKQKLQQRMREQFQSAMGGTPSWAESSSRKKKKTTADDDEDEEEDEEDDLLRRTGNFVRSSDALASGVLKVKKCAPANTSRRSDAALTSVQFHPTAQVILTAGLDQALSLFQVDGQTNPKIQSIHLERFPVHRARFTQDGEAVIATSLKNKMFYLYDMMEGRVTSVHGIRGLNESHVKEFSVCPEGGTLLLHGSSGYLHLLTLKTKEVVRSMKLNDYVAGVAFSSDGSKIFSSSEEGEVYVWDLRSSRCVNRFFDDGCVRSTSIATSPNGRFLACGSKSGVVNVYAQEACLSSANPSPLKAVMNLVTPATTMAFNPSSEILAIASRAADDAVRLLHLSSLSVFSNFPMQNRKFLYRVSDLHFSPHSGFFSVANNKGLAPLYRLLHFKDF